MQALLMDLTTTLASDPGSFGAALATLSFGEAVRDLPGRWAFDHEHGEVSVIAYEEDDSVEIHAADWTASFEPATPQAVVLAAIAVAVGRLSITQED